MVIGAPSFCTIFLSLLCNCINSCASLPAVFVRSAAGTAASHPVLVCAWQRVTHTTWRSMVATTLSWVTASTCWWGRAAVCLVSRPRMFLVASLESPAPSRSHLTWEILSYTCWEVGPWAWWLKMGWLGCLRSILSSLCFRKCCDSQWDASEFAKVIQRQRSDYRKSWHVCHPLFQTGGFFAMGWR